MNNSLLNKPVVEFYIDHGFILFPLNGKVPPKDFHWRQAEFDPFFEPHGNFGVQLSAFDLVVDIDPRNGGRESFEKLKAVLPRTLTVITGSGGWHLYYKKPEGVKIRKNLKEYKGIDFISSGGYVVAASSVHPDTRKEYVLKPFEIKPATSELLAIIAKQEITLKKGVDVYVEDDQTKQRYIEYLKNADPSVEGESGDQTTFRTIAIGRDYGLPPDTAFKLLLEVYNPRCVPPWGAEDLQAKVNNVYKYASGSVGNSSPLIAFPKEYETWSLAQDKYFHRSKTTNNIVLDQHNTALMFSSNFPLEGLIAMDLFSHQITFTKKAPWQKKEGIKIWTDEEATLCRHWLSTNYKYEPTQQLMHDAAVVAAYQYQYHPVKDYLEALVWDGHERVHNWMHTFLGCEDNDYTRAISLKVLVAGVKRIYEPGAKFDYIPVLEGDQRTGKSTAWKILASKQWFGDTPVDIAKEWSIMKTFGKWFYEWAEMETHRRANTQAMKAFLSSDTDTVRLPYNRSIQSIPRQGLFVGTFNPEKDRDIGWLHDTTGNTRYWIVETGVSGDIRNDKLEIVRDQLWAEAKILYENGVPIYFEDLKVIQMAKEEQQKRLGKDAWHDAVAVWVNAPHNLDRNILTGDEIFRECIGGGLERFKRPEMARISNVMQMIGWAKGTHYHKGRGENVSGYRRPSLEGLK